MAYQFKKKKSKRKKNFYADYPPSLEHFVEIVQDKYDDSFGRSKGLGPLQILNRQHPGYYLDRNSLHIKESDEIDPQDLTTNKESANHVHFFKNKSSHYFPLAINNDHRLKTPDEKIRSKPLSQYPVKTFFTSHDPFEVKKQSMHSAAQKLQKANNILRGYKTSSPPRIAKHEQADLQSSAQQGDAESRDLFTMNGLIEVKETEENQLSDDQYDNFDKYDEIIQMRKSLDPQELEKQFILRHYGPDSVMNIRHDNQFVLTEAGREISLQHMETCIYRMSRKFGFIFDQKAAKREKKRKEMLSLTRSSIANIKDLVNTENLQNVDEVMKPHIKPSANETSSLTTDAKPIPNNTSHRRSTLHRASTISKIDVSNAIAEHQKSNQRVSKKTQEEKDEGIYQEIVHGHTKRERNNSIVPFSGISTVIENVNKDRLQTPLPPIDMSAMNDYKESPSAPRSTLSLSARGLPKASHPFVENIAVDLPTIQANSLQRTNSTWNSTVTSDSVTPVEVESNPPILQRTLSRQLSRVPSTSLKPLLARMSSLNQMNNVISDTTANSSNDNNTSTEQVIANRSRASTFLNSLSRPSTSQMMLSRQASTVDSSSVDGYQLLSHATAFQQVETHNPVAFTYNEHGKIVDIHFKSEILKARPTSADRKTHSNNYQSLQKNYQQALEEVEKSQISQTAAESSQIQQNLQETFRLNIHRKSSVHNAATMKAHFKKDLNELVMISDEDAQKQREALLEIYQMCGGEHWLRADHWCDDKIPIQQWFGLGVTVEGYVFEINLPRNNLRGKFPDNIHAFPRLECILLDDNQLEGNLPDFALQKLKGLQILSARRNRLTGSIPFNLMSGLKNLREIWLSDNQLSGELEHGLCRLTALTHICIAKNQISGQIPPNIGKLHNLLYLSFGENQLTGPIPNSIIALAKLQTLSLHGNRLTGRIPEWLETLTNLEDLALFNNNFSTENIPTL